MHVILGKTLDGGAFPTVLDGVDASAGRLHLGPAGFLAKLEQSLGISTSPIHEPVRVAEYSKRLAAHDDGKQFYSGAADLVLETPDGYVIIDHKTFPGGQGALLEKAKSFAAQLIAYRTALEKATKIPVLSTWIHFPISGYLVDVRINTAPETFLQQCISSMNAQLKACSKQTLNKVI